MTTLNGQPSFRLGSLLALLLLTGATLVVYLPGLHGPFVFDDWSNFAADKSIQIQTLDVDSLRNAASGGTESILVRPLSRISFAMNYLFAGRQMSPIWFKSTNLAVHIVNAWLVFWFATLIQRLRDRHSHNTITRYALWMGIAAASLWALHPIQLTSILYVVQRMTSLSALCVFAGLVVYALGRIAIQSPASMRRGFMLMILGPFLGATLGVAFKENALLLPLFVVTLEYTLFERDNLDQRTRGLLKTYYWTAATLPILSALYVLFSGILAASYLGRELGPGERLLTESRVLWHYFAMIALPSLDSLSLFHDDITISTSLLSPWTTLPALGALALAVFAGMRLRKRIPILSFSIAWFLFGHLVESGPIGLEIAHEHRNYVPIFGLCLGFGSLAATVAENKRYRLPVAMAVCTFVILFGFVTFARAQIWSSEEGLIQDTAIRHPLSARAQYMMGELLAQRYGAHSQAIAHFRRAAELAPHETAYRIRIAATSATLRQVQLESAENPQPLITPDAAPLANDPSTAAKEDRCHSNADPIIPDCEMELISADLSQKPLSPNTIATLRDLSRCTSSPAIGCLPLQPLLAIWFRSALQNGALPLPVRADFTVHLFNLSIYRRDYPLALWAAKQGMATDPAHLDYVLMTANAYILLNNLDAAEALLYSTVEAPEQHLSEFSVNRDTLRAMIRARR